MKRLIFTVTNDLSHDRRMHRICSSLHDAGFKVMLIGRKLKHSKPLVVKNFDQKRLKCFFNKGKLFYFEYNLRLLFFLLNQKADVYGAIDLDTILPCLMAARLKGKKLTYDAHEYFPGVPEVERRPMIKKVWNYVQDFAIPRVDKCYTVSSSIAQIFNAKYKVDFGVIRNLPNKKQLDKNKSNKTYILYQGALNEGRGLEALILAMKAIESMPLYIAGEGDLSDKLRALVKTNQLEERVKFLGMLDEKDLHEVMSGAKIGYNVLSDKSTSYYFALNNKFFDYIQYAIPFLCSDFPEFSKINSTYCVYLPTALEVESITNNLNRLINEPELYQSLSKNALRAAENLNWEKEREKLIKIYCNLE